MQEEWIRRSRAGCYNVCSMNNRIHALSKYQKIPIIFIAVLVASILFNVFQYLSNSQSFLNRTHKVYKDLAHGQIGWTEVRTELGDDAWKGSYELWLTLMDAQPKLVDTFTRDRFSNLDWDMDVTHGAKISYWSGGPEGGTRENIFYDLTGVEQVRTFQDAPGDFEFTFQATKHPLYTVSYLTNGSCSVNASDASEVILRGIAITNGSNQSKTQQFFLSEESTVKCREIDGGLYNPSMRITDVGVEFIQLELANGKTATINYRSVAAPEVIFSE